MLWCKLGLKLSVSTMSHPQTKGHIEVINRTLITLLHPLINRNIKTWKECLPYIEFSHNRSVRSTTQMSPFEVVYSFNPLTLLDLLSLRCSE